MRKLTEALGSWCWGGTKDFPPPETNWNQYSYHVNLRWSRFAPQRGFQIVTSGLNFKENTQVTSRKTPFLRDMRENVSL